MLPEDDDTTDQEKLAKRLAANAAERARYAKRSAAGWKRKQTFSKEQRRHKNQLAVIRNAKKRAAGIKIPQANWAPEERKAYQRAWYKKNQKARIASQVKYRAKNKDKVKAYELQYRVENRDKILAKEEAYRRKKGHKKRPPRLGWKINYLRFKAKFPEKLKAINKNWREKNKARLIEKFRSYGASRRAKENGAIGGHTVREWIDLCAKFSNRCVCCGIHGETLTRDHVIPITRQGATHYIENIQPLCRSCNSKKGNRLIVDYRATPFTSSGRIIVL